MPNTTTFQPGPRARAAFEGVCFFEPAPGFAAARTTTWREMASNVAERCAAHPSEEVERAAVEAVADRYFGRLDRRPATDGPDRSTTDALAGAIAAIDGLASVVHAFAPALAAARNDDVDKTAYDMAERFGRELEARATAAPEACGAAAAVVIKEFLDGFFPRGRTAAG